MNVRPAEEIDLQTFRHDEGALFNSSGDVALLRCPSHSELISLWGAFLEEFRSCLLSIWRLPIPDVVERFGHLGTNKESKIEQNLVWGLLPQNGSSGKGILRVRQAAALDAAVDLGLIPDSGRKRTRFKGGGSFVSFLESQNLKTQQNFLDCLLAPGCDLEEVLRMPQGAEVGFAELDVDIRLTPSVEDFLSGLANSAKANSDLPLNHRDRGNAARSYGAMWFANFLVREGVWLLPAEYAEFAARQWPIWLRPIQLWMTVPPDKRSLADQMLVDCLAKPKRKNDASILHVATKLGLCSNFWHATKPCAGPLLAYKKSALSSDGESGSQRSWAVNRLWELQNEGFGSAANAHPDAHAFVLGKSLVSVGSRPFEWVHAPSPRNTKSFQRIYGRTPQAFPETLCQWANDFERLLPLFGVETIEVKIKCLEIWLLYLAGLDEPPRGLEHINRAKHVRTPSDRPGDCFRQFLQRHYSDGGRMARDAMGTLRQAWALAGGQDGFAPKLSNPFDRADSPFEQAERRSFTVRNSLDPQVAEIIARENLADDMAFARGAGADGRMCWRSVRCPTSGEKIDVFFPGAPVLIDQILTFGMRGIQARWLDSGEGDEHVLDVETVQNVTNPSKLAIVGRREGYLRSCQVQGERRETVLGVWINSGKSGPFEVPWIDPDCLAPVLALLEFQRTYYPLERPIPIERKANFYSEFRRAKGDAFPLARDPENRMGQPLSADRLRSYWKALVHHCQPIVDRELGYHYPLLGQNGSVLYDIHSLRVTLITTLLENGVPPSIIRRLVGHATIVMTLYYESVSNFKIHSTLQAALERRKDVLKRTEELSDSQVAELAQEAVTFRSEADFAGRTMLHSHRDTQTSLDVFAHGLCAGGKCETGGESYGQGRFKPVFRPRACSSCRYRITGPMFLNGLVMRANDLMWEIKTSQRRERELYAQIESEEDLGRPVTFLRTQVRRELELRDSIFEEWCVEVATIRAAEDMLKNGSSVRLERGEFAVTASPDLTQVTAVARETHEFELAHMLVQDSKAIQGSLDLPSDVLFHRDQILSKIMEANDMTEWFTSLDEDMRTQARNMFAEILIANMPSVEHFDALIAGETRLLDMSDLSSNLSSLRQFAQSSLAAVPA